MVAAGILVTIFSLFAAATVGIQSCSCTLSQGLLGIKKCLFSNPINRKNSLAMIIFVVSVFGLTRLDYLVNAILYSHGLQFSYSWYDEYSLLYTGLYQVVILVLTLWTTNLGLAVFWEVFVLSGAQDLIYFSVWSQGIFPQGNWVWTSFYETLGVWTTETQFTLAVLGLTAAILGMKLLQKVKPNIISPWGVQGCKQ